MQRFCLVIALILIAGASPAQMLLPVTPSWASLENDLYGTGLDIGDVNGDGWLDLAVSNGNDIVQAPNLVYLNNAGTLPAAASWTSTDQRFSGHCQLADVDGDGWPELMVANYIVEGWGPAQVQLYANVGGVLATTPTWESPANIHAFRAVFGDPDGDGDLDLAVATGEAYNDDFEANLIFFNVDGTLQSTPGWVSDGLDTCYDAKFVDIDQDGDQDLAFLGGGASGVVSIYLNDGGVLATTPSWTTAGGDNGNTFDFDDLDGDGRLDMLVGNNSQLNGSGRFAVYLTDGGALPAVPDWASAFTGYGSAVICADLDRDGTPDLVTGGWWEPVRVYLNSGTGSFAVEPDWQTDAARTSVVENFALADLDAKDEAAYWQEFAGTGTLLQLPRRHLQGIDRVVVDGADLTPDAYCFSLRDGWVSLAAAAVAGNVGVAYRASRALDLAVSNWDDATYVFESGEVASAVPPSVAVVVDLHAQPNPFNPQTEISFRLERAAQRVALRVFDARGREVDRLWDGPLMGGRHTLAWRPRHLASGVYFYRLTVDGVDHAGKVVLAK